MYPSEGQLVGAPASGLAKRSSELQRLAEAIVRQRDIMSGLEVRLSPVRNSMPANDIAVAQETMPHISSLVDAVGRNSDYLAAILDSLAI